MSKLPAGLALATESPALLHLTHPTTGAPLLFASDPPRPATISLLSADSRKLREVDRKIGDQRIAQARQQRNRVNVTIESVEAEQLEKLVAATTGWDLCDLSGEPLADFPYTAENARELYRAPEMAWLKEQVAAFIEDRANFKTASSKS